MFSVVLYNFYELNCNVFIRMIWYDAQQWNLERKFINKNKHPFQHRQNDLFCFFSFNSIFFFTLRHSWENMKLFVSNRNGIRRNGENAKTHTEMSLKTERSHRRRRSRMANSITHMCTDSNSMEDFCIATVCDVRVLKLNETAVCTAHSISISNSATNIVFCVLVTNGVLNIFFFIQNRVKISLFVCFY